MTPHGIIDALGRYTMAGAAAELGIHPNSLRNWIEKRWILAETLPSGVRRIPASEVERVAAIRSGGGWVTDPAEACRSARPGAPRAARSTLAPLEAAVVRECRDAWLRGREVRLSLTDRCVVRTVIGRIKMVAITGAFVVCDGWHVPAMDVLSVGHPTLEEREDYRRQLQDAEAEMEATSRAKQVRIGN